MTRYEANFGVLEVRGATTTFKLYSGDLHVLVSFQNLIITIFFFSCLKERDIHVRILSHGLIHFPFF